MANPVLGTALHGVGALSSSCCYTPQKQTKLWAWEIYWITQASFAWLILPIVGAFLTIPSYAEVLASTPTHAMVNSFLLGMLYGVGGLTFGLAIRHIGFSLHYAIAIGISAVFGTILPLIWNPNDGLKVQLVEKFSNLPGQVVLLGIIISLVGISLCGWAGVLRDSSSGAGPAKFSFKQGIPLSISAGALSAVFAFALEAGKPIESAAMAQGASEVLKLNAVLPFSNGGAFLTNLVGCLYLICKNGTGSQLIRLPETSTGRIVFYHLMAVLSGALWYFQFFFYGMGHSYLGKQNEFVSWALHMAMLILFSNIFGALFREWEGAEKRPKRILHLGMLTIVVATTVMAYGNHLGVQAGEKPTDGPAASIEQDVSQAE